MKELKHESGLNIVLKDDFKLELDISLLGGEFSSRTVADMKPVIKDDIKPSDEPLYLMYRDVHRREDDEKIRKQNLRFDLTVILPKMLGAEFDKTFGHYHPLKSGTDVSYPEIYEVISGMALCLLQKQTKIDNQVGEIYLAEVKAGEQIIMPPNFGHVTINPLNVPLVMSNWVCDGFNSGYELYEKNHGAAYYLIKDNKKGQGYTAEQNKNYIKLPKIIKARPKEMPQFAMHFNRPMYLTGCKEINKLKLLVNPENYLELLRPENLFEMEANE